MRSVAFRFYLGVATGPPAVEALVKRAAPFLLPAVYFLLTSGCGGSNSDSMMPGPASAQVRVVQGAADIGSVDTLVNGVKAQMPANPLGTPTYFAVSGARVHFEVVSAGTTGPAILDANYLVADKSYSTLMVVGEEANASLTSIALVDDHSAPATGQIKVRAVHGSGTVGPVDFYMNNVGSAFPATPTISNLTFKSASAYLQLKAANFHVCMMPAGVSPSGGFVGVGTPNCMINFTMDVSAAYPNMTLAIFDPAIIPSNNPGAFTLPVRMTVYMDLHQ